MARLIDVLNKEEKAAQTCIADALDRLHKINERVHELETRETDLQQQIRDLGGVTVEAIDNAKGNAAKAEAIYKVARPDRYDVHVFMIPERPLFSERFYVRMYWGSSLRVIVETSIQNDAIDLAVNIAKLTRQSSVHLYKVEKKDHVLTGEGQVDIGTYEGTPT